MFNTVIIAENIQNMRIKSNKYDKKMLQSQSIDESTVSQRRDTEQ